MSSPFSIFRRHQRLSMVVLTGLAMISFVLLGAINDPRDIPTPLVVVFFGCLVGGAGWLAGLKSGKASDWGVSGLLVGVLAAVLVVWSGRESSAVTMDGGNLSRQELNDLLRERVAADQFAQMAIQKTDPKISAAEFQQRMSQFSLLGGNVNEESAVLAEILLREADRLGIDVSDKTVTDYMKKLTNNKLTQEIFTEIRQDMDLTERQLLDILKEEIKARTALELLLENNRLTPQNYWDYYQKLNLKRSAEIAVVKVEDYVGTIDDPSDAELEKFFQEYRQNSPNVTTNGRFEEGRPGFRQPPRVQVAYLEAVLDDIETTIGEISDEEIQKRFEESLPKTVPDEESGSPIEGGNESLLNGSPLIVPKQESQSDSPESTETPATPDAPGTSPTSEGEAPAPESEAATVPESTDAPAETTDAPAETNSETTEGDPQAGLLLPGDLQLVALQDESQESQADAPAVADEGLPAPAAAETQSAESPAEQPAADATPPAAVPATDENPTPADAAPVEASTPDSATDKPAQTEAAPGADVPPEPEDDPTVLTDERKELIRDELRREKAQAEISKRIEAAQVFVADLGHTVAFGQELEEGFISVKDATEQIKKYAKEHQLIYIETPFLSYQDLRQSEDYTVGSAIRFQTNSAMGRPSIEDVATILFQSSPTDRFRPLTANNFQTGSEYVFWKLEHKAGYDPETIDAEPQLKEEVLKAWKMQKALPAATQRAEELAEKVRGSDKPMSEALGEIKTPDGLFLTVTETGEFTWLTPGFAPMTSMQQQSPPRQSFVAGAPNAGERFFKEVFENLQPGETGVVPNMDSSEIYVVHVKKDGAGASSTPEDIRPNFLTRSADFNTRYNYSYLGSLAQQEYRGNLQEQLWKEYNVVLASSDPAVDAQ